MDVRRSGTALVLVSLLLVSLVLGGCTSATRGTDVGFTSPFAATRVTHLSHRKQTERLATRLLAGVRVPHGARRRSSAPVRELRRPGTTEVSSNLVDRRTWWLVPGSVPHLLRHVKKHAPQGCRFDGSGSLSGPNQPTVYDIFCSARATTYAADVEVVVEALATRHGSAVRADAEAIWVPRRPAYSRIVHSSSARVVVERHATPGERRLPTVRHTIAARGAARIAAAINRLGVSPPVTTSCPADFSGVEDRLRFMTPHGRVDVTVSLTGCTGVIVRVPHHHTIGLDGATAVDTVVRHVLHLPRSYRR